MPNSYEVSDVIRYIRNPAGTIDEGSTRKRREGEFLDESRILDNAYVVVERYNKKEAVFSNLRAKRHRFMAMFRANAHEPFDDIANALHRVLVASHMLGSHYWKRQGRVQMEEQEFRNHLKGMQEQEAIFWMIPGSDVVTPIVDGAIKKVEAITDKAAQEYVGVPGRWQRRKG